MLIMIRVARVFALFAILSLVVLRRNCVDAQEGDSEPVVRLVNGSNSSEGRVEIRVNGTWGTICDSNFSFADAQVICRMLGYVTAETATHPDAFGTGVHPPLLTSVMCIGFEESILDCPISNSSCLDTATPGVKCLNDSIAVRLVDGSSASEGRLEVFYSGEWGTVCSDSFTKVEADVVCRQLGFQGAIHFYYDAHFGHGKGRIWIDNLQCPSSYESSIAACAHSSWGLHNCDHSKDVSVVCRTAPSAFLSSVISAYIVAPLMVIIVLICIAIPGFLFWQKRRKRSTHLQLQCLQNEGLEGILEGLIEVESEETTPCDYYTGPMRTASVNTSHESTLESVCYIPFNVSTITVDPQEEGVIDLVPPVQGVAEDSEINIRVEVSRCILSLAHDSITLHHAVLVDGPFQLPEGYQLASHVIYLYSDPSQPVRPFTLHLPHWWQGEDGDGGDHGDNLTFVIAPHTPSQVGEEVLYKFEMREGGNFPMPGVGSLLVNSHSSLFAIAYREKITSMLRYCATHLEREDVTGLKVDIAVTFASTTWQKILKIHRKPSVVMKAVPFGFRDPQIVAQLDETAERRGKVSLEGSAQVHKDEVHYHSHGISNAEELREAVEAHTYPPTLSFVAVYDPALKQTGQPALVKVYVDGTTKGRLCFSPVVYEEKKGGEDDPAPVLSMIQLQEYIPRLADKWVEIGNALGLEYQVLSLQTSSQPPNRCMLSLLSDWVNAGDKEVGGMWVQVSWAFLARVLRSPVVDKGSVASAIEAKYVREN